MPRVDSHLRLGSPFVEYSGVTKSQCLAPAVWAIQSKRLFTTPSGTAA